MAVAEVKEVVGNLRPATSAVAGGKRVLLVDPARAEANVRRAIAARRAGALLRAALAARGVQRAAAAVHRAVVEEELPAAEVAVEEAPAAEVAVAVGRL